jgi:hypothetical protein
MARLHDRTELSEINELQEQLTAMLVETLDEVQHIDCLDHEQRAEVYTILKALQADARLHSRVLSVLSGQGGEYIADA